MNFFVSNRFYLIAGILVIWFILGYYFPLIFVAGKAMVALLVIGLIVDFYLLFGLRGTITAERIIPERLSNGDANKIQLRLISTYSIKVIVIILEDLPVQLQIRDFVIQRPFNAGESQLIEYPIIPKTRGAYQFGYCNLLIQSPLGLIQRKVRSAKPREIKVYPSFIHINNIELAAISNNLVKAGQKRIRQVGNSQEFDHIRNYVLGDDPRRINWKASARRNTLQVNHYTDEKAQDLYCLIDKSRSMKMPFNHMTLLDYAINASLVLSHVALKRGDQAGLLTFEDRPNTFIKSGMHHHQMQKIMEALYREETSFQEVDYTSLYPFARNSITQRSLLLLFTNFESIHSLERQLPYLKLLNSRHLLLVVFFKNTEVYKVIEEEITSTESLFSKTIAYQMINEKHLINQSLRQAGILTLYTSPETLSVEAVNRYIEIKKRRIL